MNTELEVRLAEEKAAIDRVHDVCDRMIGCYYTYDERLVQVLEVNTNGRTVTIKTDMCEIRGLSADDIADEVKEFKPENAKHIGIYDDCERACKKVSDMLLAAMEDIDKDEKYIAKSIAKSTIGRIVIDSASRRGDNLKSLKGGR
jgi:phosphate uptake regulator